VTPALLKVCIDISSGLDNNLIVNNNDNENNCENFLDQPYLSNYRQSQSLSPAHFIYVYHRPHTAPLGGQKVRCILGSDENEPPSLAADFQHRIRLMIAV